MNQNSDGTPEVPKNVVSFPLDEDASRSFCHSGVLHQKSSAGDIYIKRYFVLRGRGPTARLLYSLDYLKDLTMLTDFEDRAKGIICLHGSEVWAEVPFINEEEKDVFPFTIYTGTGLRCALYAATEKERLTWMAAIEQVISKSASKCIPISPSLEVVFPSSQTGHSSSNQDAAEIFSKPSISPKAANKQMHPASHKKDVQFPLMDLSVRQKRTKDVSHLRESDSLKESLQGPGHEVPRAGVDVDKGLSYRSGRRKETKLNPEKEVQRPRRSPRKVTTIIDSTS